MLERILYEPLPNLSPDDIRATFGLLIPPEQMKQITYQELMLRQLVLKACSGNDKSIGEVLDRLIGKPTQTTEITATQQTYHSFLLDCIEKDQLDRHNVIDVEQIEEPDDLLEDLL